MHGVARSFALLSVGGLMLCAAMAGGVLAQDDAQAKEILKVAGIKSGLCVHLGSGAQKTAGLTAALAANSNMLVHGLALDDASLERARRAVETKGLLGRAIVEKVPISPLPHVRDLANLVVIEDFAPLAAQGLAMEEVQRITAPGGAVCVKKGGRWSKAVKPRPPEMDEWTHPTHGPDGNMVSSDRVVQLPLGLRWLDGVPLNFNAWAACRGWVIAGGRCFTLSTTEIENLAPVMHAKHKQEEYLTARDAFNGLPLWKVNCETINQGACLNARNTVPLATDGRRVYVFKKDKLVALDAATGQVALTYAVKCPTFRLLLSDKMLVAAGWEGKEEGKGLETSSLWSQWVSKSSVGAVEAFDASSAKLKWSVSGAAQEILAADGNVYLLLQEGNPASAQEVVAVDLKDGKEKWRAQHTKFTAEPGLRLRSAGCGVVSVARIKAKTISFLSAADGKVLWEIPNTDNFWTPMVEGLVWNRDKKYDPQTGQEKGKLPAGINSPGCTPSAIAGNGRLVSDTRGGGYIDMAPPSDDPAKPKGAQFVAYRGMRGACIQGATPAYGMYYTGQNWCRCTPGQVPGFIAVGPNGDPPAPAYFETGRPVEKGPAFGDVKPPAPADADWPMLRHDGTRGGATKAKVPEGLKALWQGEATKPPQGPLADAWRSRLASCLTAPVTAEGKVFAAAVEAGQIVALDAASGKPAWRFTAGGRIDSPPTLYRGLCLFGCHDGWVYALRAADGKLVWRTRAAPWERRMVAFGQVESVWPAGGSVLVHDDVVYASAGRTSESDGGIAVSAINPATGEQVWGRAVAPGPGRGNDLLLVNNGKVAWHKVAFDPKTGKPEGEAKGGIDTGLEGFIDGSWTRLGTRRSGDMRFDKVAGEIFVWNDTMLYAYEAQARRLYALAREKTNIAEKDKLKAEEFTWRVPMKGNHQVEAMALCDDGLLVAGRVWDAQSTKVTGFLWVVSLQDGKTTAEFPLDAPPTLDGLAVANQRVYVSLQNGAVVCFGKEG